MIHLLLEKSPKILLLLLSVDIPFYCYPFCPLSEDNVNNKLLFVMLHPKFVLLNLLLILDGEALVADESDGLSPALDKKHA